MLTPGQRDQAMRVLTELAARYNGRISATAGPLVFDREFRRIEEAMARGEAGFPGRGTLSACGGMWSKMAVLHDGTIVPCHVIHDLHLGTIGEDDFQRIWLEHSTMVRLRHRREIPLASLETCKNCRYIGFCTGGCPGGALFFNGELNSRNPMDCYRVLKGEDPTFSIR